MPIQKSDVALLLEAWYPTFWLSVTDAFKRYLKKHESELGAIHDRTKSSYINDMIVDNLKQLLSDTPKNIAWEHRFGQRRLWVDNPTSTICMRFKKLDRNLLPSNYPTQASFDFSTHSIEKPAQLRFPDLPSTTCLFLGYTANKTKTAPEAIFIICPKGISIKGKTEIEWVLQIPKPESMPISVSEVFAVKEYQKTRRVIVKITSKKVNISEEKNG